MGKDAPNDLDIINHQRFRRGTHAPQYHIAGITRQ
jgi:hypothetical protein